MKPIEYEYEVVLRVIHREQPNPDEPSLNINTLAGAIAKSARQLAGEDVTVVVTKARMVDRR